MTDSGACELGITMLPLPRGEFANEFLSSPAGASTSPRPTGWNSSVLNSLSSLRMDCVSDGGAPSGPVDAAVVHDRQKVLHLPHIHAGKVAHRLDRHGKIYESVGGLCANCYPLRRGGIER